MTTRGTFHYGHGRTDISSFRVVDLLVFVQLFDISVEMREPH